MKRKNKKAWLRIVEAFLGVMIILGGVVILISKDKPLEDTSEKIYEKQTEILKVISKNDILRQEILESKTDEIKIFINKTIPPNWGYNINICQIDNVCYADTPHDREVYVTEILITSTLTDYSPKKIRFFVWLK